MPDVDSTQARVFVSYSRQDGATFAAELRNKEPDRRNNPLQGAATLRPGRHAGRAREFGRVD